MSELPFELVCPAGSLSALKTAVDNGADCVYVGFRDDTNARNFAGLNFDEQSLRQGIDYAHQRGKKVFVALNTYPQAQGMNRWQAAVNRAVAAEVDALIIADIGLLDYARQQHPRSKPSFVSSRFRHYPRSIGVLSPTIWDYASCVTSRVIRRTNHGCCSSNPRRN